MSIASPLGLSRSSEVSSGLFWPGDVLALWARTRVVGLRSLGRVADAVDRRGRRQAQSHHLQAHRFGGEVFVGLGKTGHVGSLATPPSIGHGGCGERFRWAAKSCWREAITAKLSVEAPVEMSVEAGASKPPKRRASTVDQVLRLLRAQPELSLADVAAALGCALRTVERAAANLQAEARLRHRGPRKGGRCELIEGDP